jgi:ribosomal protein L40E
MGAFNKRMKQLRSGSTGNRILDALQLVIPAVILTADDIWCVTNEQTQQLVKGSFEIIEGYKDEGGLKALHKEFAERGIQIELHNGFSTPPYKIPERGRGIWKLVEVEEKCVKNTENDTEKCEKKVKKKTVCSRCGKGNAIKTPYCGWCGADMRPKEDKDA